VKGASVQLVQDPNSKSKKDKIYQFTSDGKKDSKKSKPHGEWLVKI